MCTRTPQIPTAEAAHTLNRHPNGCALTHTQACATAHYVPAGESGVGSTTVHRLSYVESEKKTRRAENRTGACMCDRSTTSSSMRWSILYCVRWNRAWHVTVAFFGRLGVRAKVGRETRS